MSQTQYKISSSFNKSLFFVIIFLKNCRSTPRQKKKENNCLILLLGSSRLLFKYWIKNHDVIWAVKFLCAQHMLKKNVIDTIRLLITEYLHQLSSSLSNEKRLSSGVKTLHSAFCSVKWCKKKHKWTYIYSVCCLTKFLFIFQIDSFIKLKTTLLLKPDLIPNYYFKNLHVYIQFCITGKQSVT